MTRHLPATLTLAAVALVGLVAAVRGRRGEDEWGPGSCRHWPADDDARDRREFCERIGRDPVLGYLDTVEAMNPSDNLRQAIAEQRGEAHGRAEPRRRREVSDDDGTIKARAVIHLEVPEGATDEESEAFFDAIADVAMEWKFAAPVDVNMWSHAKDCDERDHHPWERTLRARLGERDKALWDLGEAYLALQKLTLAITNPVAYWEHVERTAAS